MALVQVLANDQNMHNGENLGTLVVFDLHFLIVGKQAPNFSRPVSKSRRAAGGNQRVNLSVLKHAIEGFIIWNGLDADFRRKVEFDAFFPARIRLSAEKPFHILRSYAVVIAEKAANPDPCCHRIFRRPDFFAFEVFGLLNSRVNVVVDGRMSEVSRWKYRNTYEGGVALTDHGDMGGKRHFRDVEFLVVSHSPKNLFGLHCNVIESNPLRFDRAVLQWFGAVVVAASNGQE